MIRKVAMVLAAMVLNAQALTDVTVPKTWAARDTLTRGNLNANNDTIYTRLNQLNDSLDLRFVRFTDVKDSTFQKVKCDSIRSNPDVDSISGNPRIDTLTVTTSVSAANASVTNKVTADSARVEYIRGNPNVDSISGSPRLNAATITGDLTVTGKITGDTLVGALTVDSLRIRTGNYLSGYTLSTFLCTLANQTGDSILEIDTARYLTIGSLVSIMLPAMSGEIRNGGGSYITIPAALLPSRDPSILIEGTDNSNYMIGTVVINGSLADTKCDIYDATGTEQSNGAGGISQQCITYIRY